MERKKTVVVAVKIGLLLIACLSWLLAAVPKGHAYVFDSAKFQKGLVPDTSRSPFNAVVYIVNTETGHSGSGVLIGPDTVLTAAHVVLDDVEGAQPADWPRRLVDPRQLLVRPGYPGNDEADRQRNAASQQYRGAALSIPPAYFRAAMLPAGPDSDPGDHDLAIIHLNRPVPNAPTLPLGELRAQDIASTMISAVGYPATLGPGNEAAPENSQERMYVDTGWAESVASHQIASRTVNWAHGNSGGPILNQANQVVGIVSASNSQGNYATRINPEAACWIHEAMAEPATMLTPENVRNQWRRFGREQIYFDGQGTATQIMAIEPSAVGALDLSRPGVANNESAGHDEL
ncbi:S1 family peptidase [Leuconostocaceae bacterium ESL0958]|nr:S1 family peptidase [Leuconostocaceae bacterium ESL0958]